MITLQYGPYWRLQGLTYKLTNTFRLRLTYYCIKNSDVPHICCWRPWNHLCVPMPSACPSRLPFIHVKGFLKLLKFAKMESGNLPRNVQCPILWNARRVWGGKIRAKACNCFVSKSSHCLFRSSWRLSEIGCGYCGSDIGSAWLWSRVWNSFLRA